MDQTVMAVSLAVIALLSLMVTTAFLMFLLLLRRSLMRAEVRLQELSTRALGVMDNLEEVARDVPAIGHELRDRVQEMQGILEKLDTVADTARTATRMLGERVGPALISANAVLRGVGRAVDVWNEGHRQKGETENG